MARIVRLPNVKDIRAQIIKDRLPPGTRRVFCLSCGNASKALLNVLEGVDVVTIDPDSPLLPTREMSVCEIYKYFGPENFNATSGYLPLDWMEAVGQKLSKLIPVSKRYFVPCGSGETMMALSFFIPLRNLVGVTATYPPIEMMGPLARWLMRNADIRHAGRVNSVAEALQVTARGPGVALCWE